ncbi:hypothetical protein QQ045_027022 [Rhodiola kirilowii]
MWRSLWRTIDRFSLPHFKYVIEELLAIKAINKHNREAVVDMMQSIVEIVTYGDRHDPAIFECFMEYQVMSEFVRLLKISKTARIEAPLLQYLSIMIQNMQSEHAIYYCFSNDYINTIITHQYNFDGGDVLQYYISFLRAVSCKINRDTLCLLVKVHEDSVISFPLYTEALKFALHREKMIQTAVRALTLNIYSVSDDMVYQYVTTPPISEYFSDLAKRLRNQCFRLDAVVQTKEENRTEETRKELFFEADKIVDDLYYLKDILSTGPSRLSCVINESLLHFVIFPILLPSLQSSYTDDRIMSNITSLYVISRILQVLDVKDVINSVASVALYPYVVTSNQDSTKDRKDEDHAFPISQHLNGNQDFLESISQTEGVNHAFERGLLCKYLELFLPVGPVESSLLDAIQRERVGMLSYSLSANHRLLLASLFLLMVLAESKGLDSSLAAIVGSLSEEKIKEGSTSQFVDQSLIKSHMEQMVSALLNILVASQPAFPVTVLWHAGWLLQKLLRFQENKLNDISIRLISTSYRQSCERLRKELHGCWLDCIPEVFKNELSRCASALEVSSQNKDAIFTLELDLPQVPSDGVEASFLAWQSMVNAVKVFVLHVQLKAIVCTGHLVELPLGSLRSSTMAISGKSHALDFTTASFGSELPLGSAIPCKIAFSKVGLKDIYLIAAASGTSGKLFLLDRHPLRSHRGIAFATAPLAGSTPKVDPSHPTWLHLRIREFEPKFDTKRHQRSQPSNLSDGRWTLGFPDAEACDFARLYILDEIRKQRSAVENLLAPLLEDNFLSEDGTPNSD